MRHRYNIKLIRKHRTYIVKEVAALLGVHTRTVQQWVSKDGLPSIEGSLNPYLIHGEALALFLSDRKQSKKCPLGQDEFYCFKCNSARKSVPTELMVAKSEIRIGSKGKFKTTIMGKCEVCGTKLNRFSTYEKEALDEIN